MTPMSEIAKCQCGAEARLSPPWSGRIRAVCVNDECDIRGPRALSEAEAVARWNALMRPRPVAEWDIFPVLHDLRLRHLSLGRVSLGPKNKWFASCFLTGEHSFGLSIDDARAWLVERVRVA